MILRLLVSCDSDASGLELPYLNRTLTAKSLISSRRFIGDGSSSCGAYLAFGHQSWIIAVIFVTGMVLKNVSNS